LPSSTNVIGNSGKTKLCSSAGSLSNSCFISFSKFHCHSDYREPLWSPYLPSYVGWLDATNLAWILAPEHPAGTLVLSLLPSRGDSPDTVWRIGTASTVTDLPDSVCGKHWWTRYRLP
jgi:hypothetical protein